MSLKKYPQRIIRWLKKEIKKYPIKFIYFVFGCQFVNQILKYPMYGSKTQWKYSLKELKRKSKKDPIHFTYFVFGCQEKFTNQI